MRFTNSGENLRFTASMPMFASFRPRAEQLRGAPASKPKSGRIAVKVINHLGDEVMKVFKV